MLRVGKPRSQIQELVLCWESSDTKTGVEDIEGSPMADVQTAEGETRGGEERSERMLVAAKDKDSNEREGKVSRRM